MIVEVKYSKEVKYCGECPYYTQERDMGAIIPICTYNGSILHNPNIISDDCPISKTTELKTNF